MSGVKRDDRGRILRGSASNNPLGAKQGVGHVRRLAREHTEAAIETLADICKNGGNERSRVAAATALLDRGWGKPAQTVEHEVKQMSDQELRDKVRALLERKKDTDGPTAH